VALMREVAIVDTAEWIFSLILTLMAAVLGHVYIRQGSLMERLTRAEASIPEILVRIERTLDKHVNDEARIWEVIDDMDGKVDILVTDVAILKNGGGK